MRNILRYCFVIVNIFLLVGCATIQKQHYVSISQGLPTGQQWKCNPAFGDVNEDGLKDLAAIPRKAQGPRVWIHQANGTWTEASDGLLKHSSCGGGVDFGDIDNDGHLDLAVADHCKGIFVYTGSGKGTWTPATKGLPEMPADDVALGDFNKDGRLDLCACSSTDEGIGLFWGNGKGGWNKASDTGLPETGCCHQLALGDFNNDGMLDVVATMVDKPQAWLSSEPGRWKNASRDLPDLPWGGQYWGAAVGDVNKDGYLDLALARIVKGPEVFLGDGNGSWRPVLNGLSKIESAWGIAMEDLDGDGHLDLLVSGKEKKKNYGNAYGVFLFLGDGNGNWKRIVDTGLPQNGLYQSWGLALSDIDGDGTLEIGGCFGISHSDEPIDFLGPSSKKEDISPGQKFGPGGSIRVWKIER